MLFNKVDLKLMYVYSYNIYCAGLNTGFFVRGETLGTLGGCPIEIMPLEIIELELTNFN